MYDRPLDYHNIDEADFYHVDLEYSKFKDHLYTLIDSDSADHNERLIGNMYPIQELLTSIRHYHDLMQSDSYLWYEHPILVNDNNYTLLTAKKATFSKETIATSLQACMIVGVIILICFTIWIFFIVFQTISNRRLYRAAFIDPITNYNNAAKFRMETNKLIRKHKKQSYALVLLDIDNFKILNDLYGYENANVVLKNVCSSIRQMLYKKETCTRYAADEYMMLLKYNEEAEIRDRIIKINQYVLMNASVPNIKFSYGVYFIQDYTLSVEQMSIYAGMAKDTIKGLKDEFIGTFNESIRQAQIRDKELENATETAFQNKEFVVYLQPKYNAITNKIGGAEALVRWISPSLGFISPGEFIPLFEKNHMIIRLDNYMLEEVCRQQRQWMDEGKELVTISVNLSRIHLTINSLLDDILSIVDRYGIPHKYIEFELTESAFFDGKDQLLHVVSSLQSNGFLVSMDDFGSGYSSLNSLKDLPLDVIKLDGEFFRTTDNTERSETVIRDTINLAKHLQMKIVAEGVETKDQVDFLNEIGCDLIQGFYFAKPMPIVEFEKKCYES
ncbi:MAG: phosphodiesterase [Clostridiales bacterium]|nr:phosphodiesterase [Clostridiales bacterium]